MKKILFLFASLVFIHSIAFARILRVGFSDVPPVAGVDYATSFLAYSAAESGDSIYIFPGKVLGGAGWPEANLQGYQLHITKRIIFISKGFWLDNVSTPAGNADQQASKGTGLLDGTLYFDEGSAGSILMGFNLNGRSIVPNEDSITIRRNFNVAISLPDRTVANLVIEGNYRLVFGGDNNAENVYSDIFIRNNFIYSFQLPQKSYRGVIENNTWAYDLTEAGNGGDLAMSYFDAAINTGNCNFIPGCGTSNINLQSGTWLFQNNLMVSLRNASAAENYNVFKLNNWENSTLRYNVVLTSGNDSLFWTGNGIGNKTVPPSLAGSIFEAFPLIAASSADGRYRLQPGSPASIAGRPGSTTDAGMYGGDTPYKLSAIPAIPTIYKLGSPEGNTPINNQLKILIGTRTND